MHTLGLLEIIYSKLSWAPWSRVPRKSERKRAETNELLGALVEATIYRGREAGPPVKD